MTQAAHPTAPNSSSRPGIWYLAIGETLVWACLLYVFPAQLLRWEEGFGWSKAGLTGALTVALLCSALCSPMVGRLIDRGAGPVLLAGGAVVGGLGLVLLTQISALWQFYLVWALIGVALAACLYEPCFMVITRAYGAAAKRSIITVTLIAGFASTISFPTAHLLSEHYGFRSVLWCFAGVTLFIGAPLLYYGGLLVERDVTTASQPGGAHKTQYLKNPLLLKLAFAFAALALVHGATLHHLLPLLKDRGIAVGSAVLVASLIGPMQVAGRLFITAMQNRLSHSVIALSCFVFIGLSMGSLYLARFGLGVAIGFAVLFGGSYGVVSIIRPVIARDLLGEKNFGAKSGLLAFFYLIGSAIAPYFASLVWSVGGYDLLLVLLLAFSAAGLLLMRAIIRTSTES